VTKANNSNGYSVRNMALIQESIAYHTKAIGESQSDLDSYIASGFSQPVIQATTERLSHHKQALNWWVAEYTMKMSFRQKG
jgi:hypothetical protein